MGGRRTVSTTHRLQTLRRCRLHGNPKAQRFVQLLELRSSNLNAYMFMSLHNHCRVRRTGAGLLVSMRFSRGIGRNQLRRNSNGYWCADGHGHTSAIEVNFRYELIDNIYVIRYFKFLFQIRNRGAQAGVSGSGDRGPASSFDRSERITRRLGRRE